MLGPLEAPLPRYSDSFSHACVLRRSSGACRNTGSYYEYSGYGAMSWFSGESRLYDFNAPNRLKLGWMGPQSVATYDAATGGLEDWAGGAVLGTAYVSALNLGPATDRHLLLKIPCPTCTSAWDRFSHDNGNVYVSFRGDDAAGSTYGVDNTIYWLNTFEGGACTNNNLRLMTNRVHVHYQRTNGAPSELWTTLDEGESYEIAGAAVAIHVCTINSESGAVVTVGADSVAAKALCTTPWPPTSPPSPPALPPLPISPPSPPPFMGYPNYDCPCSEVILAGTSYDDTYSLIPNPGSGDNNGRPVYRASSGKYSVPVFSLESVLVGRQ